MGFSFWSKNGQQGQQKKDNGSPSSSSKSAQSRKAHSSPMESIRSWISKISGFFRTQEESASQVQRGNYGSLTGSNSLSSDSGAFSFTERRETEPTKEVKKVPYTHRVCLGVLDHIGILQRVGHKRNKKLQL